MFCTEARAYERGIQGYSYPGLRGPGKVQVYALSFGVAPSGVCVGLNFSEDLFFWSSPNFGQKIGLKFSEDLFFWFSPDFGQKIGLKLSEDLFSLVFT